MQLLARHAVLVVSGDPTVAAQIDDDLRALGRTVSRAATCAQALTRLGRGGVGLVLVDVDSVADWIACGRIAAASRCPVAIVTRFLARDRRFRETAFGMRISAYVAKPCTPARLRELVRQLRSGARSIELVDPAIRGEL